MEYPRSRALRVYDEITDTAPEAWAAQAYAVAGKSAFYTWSQVSQNILAAKEGGTIAPYLTAVPDGRLASGNVPGYSGLDVQTVPWPATPVAAGAITLRFSASAVHNPSVFHLWITREGYDASKPATWADLQYLGKADASLENMTYLLKTVLPARTGRHVLYCAWQRIDPAGEVFFSYSDIDFTPGAQNGSTPTPTTPVIPPVTTTPVPATPAPADGPPTEAYREGLSVVWNAPSEVWGSGFLGSLTVTNTGTAPVSDWMLHFSAPWSTSGSGNAGTWKIVGQKHTVLPPAWTGYSLAPGKSVVIDFTGQGTPSVPTDFVIMRSTGLCGTPAPGEGTATTPPPVTTTPPVTTPPVTVTPAEPAASPAWNAASVYTAGDIVSFGAQNYRAGWWVTGNPNPAAAYAADQWGVWRPAAGSTTPVTPTTPGTPPTTTPVTPPVVTPPVVTPPVVTPPVTVTPGDTAAPAWKASSVYTAGDIVSFGGQNYRAGWWVTGNPDPAASYAAGQWGVWRPYTGSVTPVTPTTPVTPPVTTPVTPPVTVTPPDNSAGVVTVTSASPGWPAKVFAPYVDITLANAPADIRNALAAGVKYFTLAFVTANGTQPAFAGASLVPKESGDWDIGTRAIKTINAARAAGGDVMVSFGGANGVELAAAIRDVDALTAAYQSVIDRYKLGVVDFDIEGATVADSAANARRAQAIVKLQRANPGLKVWFTVAVFPEGMVQDGINLIDGAVAAGVTIHGVNGMAMDYGHGGRTDMGDAAISVGNGLASQLKTIYARRGVTKTDAQLKAMVGITAMIGQNDTAKEVFGLADANDLLAYAKANNIGFLSLWSLTRDHAGNSAWADASNSGIPQQEYEFSKKFNAYAK